MKALKKVIYTICLILVGVSLYAQNPCPTFDWAKSAGGTGFDIGQSIAVDNVGNSYITGIFEGTSTFGGTTLTSSGYSDIFIAKLDADGNFLWAKQAGGTDYDATSGIVVDNNGNSYITGTFLGTATFGNFTLSTDGNGRQIFIAKLDNNGNYIWIKQASIGYGSGNVTGVGLDTNANIYIAGQFVGTAYFGGDTLTTPGGSNYDLFISKLDNNGDFLWAKQSNSISTNILMYGFKTDDSGNSYLTGTYNGYNTMFGSPLYNNSGLDVYIVKLDNMGNNVWVQTIASPFHDVPRGIDVDNNGNVYISGEFNNSYGIKKFSSSGTLLSSINSYGGKIKIKNNSNIYEYGNNVGNSIRLLDSLGGLIWSINAIGATSYKNMDIDNNGNCYVIGDFNNTVIFNNDTLTNLGGADINIIKISNDFPYINNLNDTSIHCGESAMVSPIAQNYSSAQWLPANGVSNPNDINPTFSPNQTTTYTLTLTDDCGNTTSEQVTITVTDPVFTVYAQASNSTINCGTSTDLHATIDESIDNMTYSWTPTTGLDNPNIANPIASPGLTTTYTVTATTPNGCSTSDDVTITVYNPNPPTVNIQSNTGDFYLCDNGLTLSAPGFASYEWSNGSTSPAITVTQPGEYSVIVYEESGCAGQATITVTTLADITAPLGTVLCPNQPGQKVKLVATSGMDSYQWNNGAETQSIQVDNPGAYSCTVTKNGCSYTISIQVTMSNGQASADFSYQPNGMDVQFTAISPSINFLSWNFGDGETSFEENPLHTYNNTGMYDVTVTITDVCGNTAGKTKTINVSGTAVLNQESVQEEVLMYPNPTQDQLNFLVKNTPIKKLIITDLNGKVLFQKVTNEERTTINVAELSKGMYLVHIKTDNGKVVKQFVKE